MAFSVQSYIENNYCTLPARHNENSNKDIMKKELTFSIGPIVGGGEGGRFEMTHIRTCTHIYIIYMHIG